MSKLSDLMTAAQIVLDHARERFPHFESLRGKADLLSLEIALRAAGGETKEEEGGLEVEAMSNNEAARESERHYHGQGEGEL